ncbi:MAG: hypothetical protein OXH86_04030 [Acidimicrobiaceae bacterium]|nr:hypothetical protein [Acidimicrobiaceae bacterium]MDE0320565.1 hypothetical protein [Acidimicrobiaceae bacterium]MDE0496501.1 hypothetical protein [Acidimicrobiaceae bacterium]
MERSPFPYQGPLMPEQVTGREELRRDLAQRIADRRLTALIGPRRYGKTSVLKRVAADLEDVDSQAVWIDLYELTSMSDLAARVDSGLNAVTGTLREMLGTIASTMSLNLGVVRAELSRSARRRPDPALTLQGLLDLLVRAAERRKLFVVFDEFSGIAQVQGAAGALRTALQHHFQSLGIVFAGSEPSTMRTLFGAHGEPFFSQADLVEIGPLEDAELHRIIEEGFEGTGRTTGGITSQITALAQGHPQRAMQLADAVWRLVEPGGRAGAIVWEHALTEVRGNVEGGFERQYSSLAAGHQKVLRTVATDGSIYGTAAQFVDLNAGTASAAAAALVGDGVLRRSDKRLSVIDPLLADWVRRRFA